MQQILALAEAVLPYAAIVALTLIYERERRELLYRLGYGSTAEYERICGNKKSGGKEHRRDPHRRAVENWRRDAGKVKEEENGRTV